MKNVDKIIKLLEEYEIEVYGKNFTEGRWYILAKNCILAVDSKKTVILSFHVYSDPIYSAQMALILSDCDQISSVKLGDVFIYDQDGKYHVGEEALNLVEECKKQNIIGKFIEEQMQRQFLLTVKGGTC